MKIRVTLDKKQMEKLAEELRAAKSLQTAGTFALYFSALSVMVQEEV